MLLRIKLFLRHLKKPKSASRLFIKQAIEKFRSIKVAVHHLSLLLIHCFVEFHLNIVLIRGAI